MANANTIYPWDKWLSRKNKLVLIQGVDFDCQPHGMAQQFRNKCYKHEPKISPSIKFRGNQLEIRLTHSNG